MKGKIKYVVILAAVLLIAGIVYIRVFKPDDTEVYETRPTVAVEEPAVSDIVLYTELTGTIEPLNKASVVPKMGGEIIELFFAPGDYVEEGQVLARIDTDALESLQLQVDAAEVSLTNANNTLRRTRALYNEGFVSEESMEQAENSARSAQISYDSAKRSYDLQLEYTTVLAPMSGMVESRSVELHDNVSTSTAICEISGLDDLKVKFGVTETTLANIVVGDPLTVEKNGSDYEGEIIEIGTMVGSSGLYDVKGSISAATGLTNGSRVKVTVVMDRALDALTVPIDAVTYEDGDAYVYLYKDGAAYQTFFEAGIYDSENVEVLSGIEPSDIVITTWSNELSDGQEVLLADASDEDGQVSAE